jgi:hypothetical protein
MAHFECAKLLAPWHQRPATYKSGPVACKRAPEIASTPNIQSAPATDHPHCFHMEPVNCKTAQTLRQSDHAPRAIPRLKPQT